MPNRFLKAVAVATALSTAVSTAPVAQAGLLQTVKQGNAVIIGGISCTVGYVDKQSRTAYVALHCADSRAGERVFVNGVAVGYTMYDTFTFQGGTLLRNDVQPVRLYADTRIEDDANTYTGDALYPYGDIQIGDKTCSYSRRKNAVLCGEVVNVSDGVILTNHGGIHGDSGGPVWRVDDAGNSLGSIGVYSYSSVGQDTHYGYSSTEVKACGDSKSGIPIKRTVSNFSPGCGLREDRPGAMDPISLRQPSVFRNGTGDGGSSLETDPMLVLVAELGAIAVMYGYIAYRMFGGLAR